MCLIAVSIQKKINILLNVNNSICNHYISKS